MDPYDLHSMVDPFGGLGHGMPGDPMEEVLSLQTYSAGSVAVPCSKTCACNTGGCTTNSCTFSCAATRLEDGSEMKELEERYDW